VIDAETRAKAVEMYASGMAAIWVAEELGLSDSSVLRFARAARVPIRHGHGDYAAITEAEVALTGGRWVNVRGVQRWVPDPPPRPVATLLACSCGATLADPCDHQNRVVSRRCPCGNRPREGEDYCTTECRDEAEGAAA